MSNKTVVETVTALVEPILAEHNFELYEVEFVQEAGITLEDCALVSDQLSEQLDSTDPDPIPQAYFLEVSSPGAERPLKKEVDYQRALDQYVNVSLYQQIDGHKVFEGYLRQLSPDELTIEYMDKTRQKQVVIPRDKVAKARLAIKF